MIMIDKKTKSSPFKADEISIAGGLLFDAIEKGCMLPPNSLSRSYQRLRGSEQLFTTSLRPVEDIKFLYNCIKFKQRNVNVTPSLKLSDFQQFFKEWLERRGEVVDETV